MSQDAMRGGAPLWTGSVEADGYWLSEQWLSLTMARQTLLRHWISGSELYCSIEPAGWLLLWPRPRRVDGAELPGLPIRRLSGGLSSCARCLPGARLSLLWGDSLRDVALRAEDPASWLELGALEVWVQRPPRLASVAAPAAPPHSVRGVLPGVPAPSAELQQLLRGDSPVHRAGTGATQPRPAWWQRVQYWVSGLVSHADANGNGSGNGSGQGRASSSGRGVGARLGLLARVRRLLGRSMGLARLYRWQHVAYLRRLMEQLDRGDWDEALRHAIPLKGDPDAPQGSSLMSMLRPRTGLDYRRSQSSIGLSDTDVGAMHERYRQAFRALDAAGEVDKAAYVLAELLRETDEALRYLARHDRHRSAAELAELRGLPVARQIALWLKAGERQRALRLALLHQAYAAALVQLRDDAVLCTQLRRAWAARLYEGGQLLAAIEVLWPVAEDRPAVIAWLREARAQGLDPDPQLLAREARLLPEHFEAIASTVQAWLEQSGAVAHERIRSFAQALSAGKAAAGQSGPTPQVQALARHVQRALWCRPSLGGFDLKLLEQLQQQAADPYFYADQPKSKVARSTQPPVKLPIQLQHQARGSLPIVALSPMMDGHCLLALGESGSMLIDLEGRHLQRFRQAVTQLVGAHDSKLRLGLVPRTDGWVELARLDLQHARGTAWVELRLDLWSANLVNGVWAVARGSRVQLLDVSGAQPVAIWDSGELPAAVRQLLWDDTGLLLLIGGGADPLQLWLYRAAGMSLSERVELSATQDELNPPWAQTAHLRPRCLLELFAPAHADADWRLQRAHGEHSKTDVWRGKLSSNFAVAQSLRLLQLPMGLALLARSVELHSDDPAAIPISPKRNCAVHLWSQNHAALVHLEASDVEHFCIASDHQHLWVAADGGVLRIDPLHAEVRWIVP